MSSSGLTFLLCYVCFYLYIWCVLGAINYDLYFFTLWFLFYSVFFQKVLVADRVFFFVICLRLSFLASWSCFFYIILYVISPVYMLADRVFFCTMRIFAKEILIYDNVILHLYYRDKHTKLCSRNPVCNPLLPFLLLSQFVLLFLNPNNLVS